MVSRLGSERGHVLSDRTQNQMCNGSGPPRTSGDINHTEISSKETVKVWRAHVRAVRRLEKQILNDFHSLI